MMTDRWPWKLKRTDGLPDHFVLVDALDEKLPTALVEGTSFEWSEIVRALREPRSHEYANRVAISWDVKTATLTLYSPRNRYDHGDAEWTVYGSVKAFELADSLEASLIDTICPKCRERGGRVRTPIAARWEICARCRGEYGTMDTNTEGY